MTDHHGLGPVPRGFVRAERPAQVRPHAEDIEEVVGHRHAAEALGFSAAAQQVVADSVEREVAGDRRERPRPCAQIEHVAHLGRLPGEATRVAICDPHQPIGLGERHGTQQQRVHDAEHGGAGSNTEAGDQDDEGREPRITPQRPEGVAEVLEKCGESHESSAWTTPPSQRLAAAEPDECARVPRRVAPCHQMDRLVTSLAVHDAPRDQVAA
jgi:hypothetical protein